MSYYDKNYYPTPRAVIDKMLEPFKEQIKTMNVLEPSAGMGAIADAVKWQQTGNTKRIYCCEIDENMKATLAGKGYKVIQGDFLQYSGSMNFDLIVMNPPFDRGAEHLLKAWEILRDGDVVCLLNEETLKSPHTQARRELIDIIEKNGSVEYLGAAFDNADRKTGVRVAMVRLKKKSNFSELHFNLNATGAPDITKLNFESQSGELERADYIGAMIRAYEKAVASTTILHKAMTEFSLFTSVFAGEYGPSKMCNRFFETSQKQIKESSEHSYSEAHNEFVMELQKCAWNRIFDTTAVAGMMTDKVRQKFNKWREDMGGADLNRENIGMLFEALIQQRGVIGEECILEAFDRITEYSEKNRQNFKEAYKTNSAYMVGSKFILNYVVESGWSGGLSVHYQSRQKLDDIDRALCMVSGKRFEDLVRPNEAKAEHLYQTMQKLLPTTTYESIAAWCKDRSQPQESEFFTFKCYQKGSAHFTFKDEKLRMEFNRIACAKKGWQLPEQEFFKGKARRK